MPDTSALLQWPNRQIEPGFSFWQHLRRLVSQYRNEPCGSSCLRWLCAWVAPSRQSDKQRILSCLKSPEANPKLNQSVEQQQQQPLAMIPVLTLPAFGSQIVQKHVIIIGHKSGSWKSTATSTRSAAGPQRAWAMPTLSIVLIKLLIVLGHFRLFPVLILQTPTAATSMSQNCCKITGLLLVIKPKLRGHQSRCERMMKQEHYLVHYCTTITILRFTGHGPEYLK